MKLQAWKTEKLLKRVYRWKESKKNKTQNFIRKCKRLQNHIIKIFERKKRRWEEVVDPARYIRNLSGYFILFL